MRLAATKASAGGSSGNRVQRANDDPLTDPTVVAGPRPIPSGLIGGHLNLAGIRPGGRDPGGRPHRDRNRRCHLTRAAGLSGHHCDGCNEFRQSFRDAEEPPLPDSVSAVMVEVGRAASGVTRVLIVMSDRAGARLPGVGISVLRAGRAGLAHGHRRDRWLRWSDVVAMVHGTG
jgi:hypothetical protein